MWPCIEALARTLAAELADEFPAIYNTNKLACRVEHTDVVKRSLRNTRPALSGVLVKPAGEHAGSTQYHKRTI